MAKAGKVCPSCQVYKTRDKFYTDKHGYMSNYCKPCARKKSSENKKKNPDRTKKERYKYQWKFNHNIDLDVDARDNQLALQNYACGICKDDLTEVKHHWDHDHSTLKFRLILCNKCNMGIGLFDEDPNLLRLAASYLELFK